VIYLHGGALMMGARQGISTPLIELANAGEYVAVSVDYRLAPESKMPDILRDIRTAFHWVHEQGPALFQADTSRIAMMGHSAGGYLSLLAGHQITPRPTAIVSYYGYGDIMGPWYSQPDPFYCATVPAISREEALEGISPHPISENGHEERGKFYHYCRQQGTWPQEVLGKDPTVEPEAFYPYCPERNVTPDYPPTLLLHGNKDTDVPYELSVSMAAALQSAGVQHDFITIDGGGHGFVSNLTDPQVIAAEARVREFLKEHLK